MVIVTKLLTVGYILLLVGCAPFLAPEKFGTEVTPEQKAKIVIGKTTKVDLLRELGEPDQIINLGGGKEQLSYISEQWGLGAIAGLTSPRYTEFWIMRDKGIVVNFGERPTTKQPKYIK